MVVRDWLWDRLGSVVGDGDGGGGGGSGATGEAERFQILLSTLRNEILTVLRRTSGDVTGGSCGRPADVAMLSTLHTKVRRIFSALRTQRDDLARHVELLEECSRQLWINQDEALAVRQSVSGEGGAGPNKFAAVAVVFSCILGGGDATMSATEAATPRTFCVMVLACWDAAWAVYERAEAVCENRFMAVVSAGEGTSSS